MKVCYMTDKRWKEETKGNELKCQFREPKTDAISRQRDNEHPLTTMRFPSFLIPPCCSRFIVDSPPFVVFSSFVIETIKGPPFPSFLSFLSFLPPLLIG